MAYEKQNEMVSFDSNHSLQETGTLEAMRTQG